MALFTPTSKAQWPHDKKWLWVGMGAYALLLLADSFFLPAFQDEQSFLKNVIHFTKNNTLVPTYVNYPTFYSYLIFLPSLLVFFAHYALNHYPWAGLHDPYFIHFVYLKDQMIWIWTARSLSILCGLGILYLVVKYTWDHYGRKAALGAGAILILDPLGVYAAHARYGLPDIIVAFLVLVIALSLIEALENKNYRLLFQLSFLAGAAMSAKMNAVIVLAPLFIFPLMERPFLSIPKFLFMIGGVITGMFITSPFLFILPDHYKSGFATEALFLLGPNGSPLPFLLESGWIVKFVFSKNFIFGMLVLGAVILALRQKTRFDKIFLSLLFCSIVLLGSLHKQAAQYFIFLYPLTAIMIGRLWAWGETAYSSAVFKKIINLAAVGLCVYFTTGTFLRTLKNFSPDNRIIAGSWILKNIPPRSIIYTDWSYVPELITRRKDDEYFFMKTRDPVTLSIFREYFEDHPPYRIVNLLSAFRYKFDPRITSPGQYLIVSSYCYDAYLRQDRPDSRFNAKALNHEFADRRNFYINLFAGDYGFREVKSFAAGSGPVIRIFQRLP